MKRETDQKLNLQNLLAPVMIGAFFCFLYFYFGVGVYPDSVTYIENYMDREPLYPLLLKLFRMIFGSGFYLKAAVFFQNVFAFLVTWYLYTYVSRKFHLRCLLQCGALAALLLPHLITGIFTSSGIVLTNAVLSEGISLTLYQLFFVYLLKMIYEKEQKKYGLMALVTALITVFARGHMMPMLLVWMVVAVFCEIRTKRIQKQHISWLRVAGIILVTALSFIIRFVGVSSYNLVVYGYFSGNTSGNMTLLTNVLYSADEEDVAQLDEHFSEEEKQLLAQVYTQMQEEKWTYADAKRTLLGRVEHHEECHDRIKFEILYPVLEQAMEKEFGNQDPTLIRIRMDELAGRYMKALFPKCIGNWLCTYFYVMCSGFIRTVAIMQTPFMWYALFIYIVAIVFMWYLFKKRKSYDAGMMTALVLLMIAANVCATAMTIMCLSRYMIYNMSLFYLAGIVMLQEVWRMAKKYPVDNTPIKGNGMEENHGISESGI